MQNEKADRPQYRRNGRDGQTRRYDRCRFHGNRIVNRARRNRLIDVLARTIDYFEKCLEKPALPGDSAPDLKRMVMPQTGWAPQKVRAGSSLLAITVTAISVIPEPQQYSLFYKALSSEHAKSTSPGRASQRH